ncbi:MAG: flavin reductase family protein [Butyrivibrio sp.]|nr:flavin reductase family protein [Butyrivibrio sp.]
MHVFQPVSPEEVDDGAFTFNGGKMLISAASGDKVDSTTASYGGVGYIWGRRVIYVCVKSNRLIRDYLDDSGEFSVSFLNRTTFRGELKYMEAVSGRDEDKIANARLTVNYDDGIPFIDEADNVITAKVLFRQGCEKEGFVDESILDEFYKDGVFHHMYIGEIQKILIR